MGLFINHPFRVPRFRDPPHVILSQVEGVQRLEPSWGWVVCYETTIGESTSSYTSYLRVSTVGCQGFDCNFLRFIEVGTRMV
jgi:hypothetical protein